MTPRRQGWVFLAILVLLLGALSLAHLGQGNAAEVTRQVLLASRLPRLLAGLLVGAGLGLAGATLQGLTRNPLASPDTLAVNAGAHLALTATAGLGIGTGVIGGAGVALLGGLAAAAAVLSLGRGGSSVRMVLGGSVLALALGSITSGLMLVFSDATQGLFGWGAGTLSQPGMGAVAQLAAPMVAAMLALVALAGRVDLLQLGDDAAHSLGVNVGRTKLVLVVLAVVLAAGSVTLTGPIGFVGLCAPALARIAGRWVRALRRQVWVMPASALLGALLVIGSDVCLRAAIGSADAVEVPTGVVTTLIGGVFLVLLSRGMRTGTTQDGPTALARRPTALADHSGLVIALLAVAVAVCGVLALLLGDGLLLLGDVSHWLQGVASKRITWTLDARAPRVAAALCAGAALAVAGALTQTVTRNPLADPGVLGVSGGAGVGALSVIAAGGLSTGLVNLGALAGAVVSGLVVFGLSARGGWQPTRLVLVGLGVQAITSAAITLLVVATDPWNQSRAITWLGGSTYGVQFDRVLPLLAVLVVVAGVLTFFCRELDLVQLDEVTPRLLGVTVGSTRLLALVCAVVLTAAATSAIGVIGFVGLVAPHAARHLLGSRHHRLLPASALVGALLVLVADTAGRSLLAPAQLPVGLVCSLVGVPWFCWLLHRMRVAS